MSGTRTTRAQLIEMLRQLVNADWPIAFSRTREEARAMLKRIDEREK